MAPQISPRAVSSLRAISFRISAASTAQLPHVATYVAQSLHSCKDLLSESQATLRKDSDAGVVLHRYQTQITTLLQGRTTEERWAAIVLIKATIEAGGWEVLGKSSAWVRGLLAILKKPDPPLAKCLCITTLTRIFMLTWNYPTLIREITTPALPAFITACLFNVSSAVHASSELVATLESFVHLLPRHPTVFRNQQDEIQRVLGLGARGFGNGHSLATASTDVQDLTSRLVVLLHQCEPKQGASAKWERAMADVVKTTHSAADRLFIAVDESWQSAGNLAIQKHVIKESYEQAQRAQDVHDRPPSKFVFAGSKDVLDSLRLLRSYLAVGTSAAVTAPVGLVVDLVTRLFATAGSADTSPSTIRFIPGVSKEEREALAEVLPSIHVEALRLLSCSIDRYGLLSLMSTILDQVTWLFKIESSNVGVRTACYTLLKQIVFLAGPSLDKDAIRQFGHMIRACCDDLLPEGAAKPAPLTSAAKTNQSSAKQNIAHADTFLKQGSTLPTPEAAFRGLHQAARALLPVLLSTLPSKLVPVAQRTQMDRTAVLTRHKEALVASVLNPPVREAANSRGSSLLPLLVRECPHDAEVEALIRPRMPVLQTGRREEGQDAYDEGDGEDMDDAEDSNEDQAEDDQEPDAMSIADLGDDANQVVDPSAARLPTNGSSVDAKSALNGRHAPAGSNSAQPSPKRPIEFPALHEEPDAKRARASPVAHSSLGLTAAADVAAPATDVATGLMPRTVVLETPQQSQQAASESATVVVPEVGGSGPVEEEESDEDDFVIPVLDLVDSGEEDEDGDEE